MPAYKNEQRGTWYCKFYYEDWQGKRKQKKKEGFKTQREAKAYEREFLSKTTADCSMTFGSLVELYLEDCRSRLKPTTLYNKETMINTKLLPYLKDIPLSDFDAAKIRHWQNELIAYRDEKGKPYSETYLKTVNNQLSAIFNYAQKYYKLPENPVRVCGSIGKHNADSMQFWTLQEFKRFISVLEDAPLQKIIFSLLFWTGMRSGELLALTLTDFDLDAKTVQISKNFAQLDGKDLILTPKTSKSKRTITLPDFLCNMLREYTAKLYDYRPPERLFPVNKHYINYEMQKACMAAGVKKIRVHDLRHSHASLLIEQGFSPLLISERLGHENIQTTLQTYSHLYPNKHSLVAEKLDELNN
ncbi:MAG: site-specific integrase [Clostridia bacterium]|nr:site-specific integrase [Clostridia bacterium]